MSDNQVDDDTASIMQFGMILIVMFTLDWLAQVWMLVDLFMSNGILNVTRLVCVLLGLLIIWLYRRTIAISYMFTFKLLFDWRKR